MSMDYIRDAYNVPAQRGARVEYRQKGHKAFGTITGSRGPYLRVRMDGSNKSAVFHPTWNLTYIAQEAKNDE